MTDDKCEDCYSYIEPTAHRPALCNLRSMPTTKERTDEFCGPDAVLFYRPSARKPATLVAG